MLNPRFKHILKMMDELHDAKNHDYAHDGSPYSNFEETAEAVGVDIHVVFDVLIGIKNARLRQLRASGKDPQHESVQDTLLDRAVYAALAASYDLELEGEDVRG